MNDVGTKLYDLTLKEILKCCKNKEQKIMADFVLGKTQATQIYNVTDVVITNIKNSSNDSSSDIIEWVDKKTGISIQQKYSTGVFKTSCGYTPYVDDLFTYAKTNNNMWYVGLFHRLDDERIIMFFGTVNDNFKFTIFESITIETNLLGMTVDYSHMVDSVEEYIVREGIYNPNQIQYLRDSIHICFTGYFTLLMKMFKDLTDKDKKQYRCYIDECEDNKSYYYRSPLNKKVTKVGNKPIILVLENNKEADLKSRAYKRRNGKIHYAFSWVVRGHYRKLHNPNSIGMDRNGVRCMPGVTWIETYMKGDENLPLLKRERIVIDKR